MNAYGYFEDGKIIAPVSMRSRFNGIGGWHVLSDSERAAHGWYPCAVINEGYDSLTQNRSLLPEISFDSNESIFRVEYTVTEKTVEAVKREHRDRISHSRYETEISGIVVNDQLVETDRTSQTRIAQAHALVSIDPTTKIDWKVGNEWIVLDASTITAMALAIGKHVQECFSKEMRLHKQIDEAETIDDVLKINW